MVADPFVAGHEHHRARHPLGDAHRVVRGARVHAHERLARRGRCFFECRDDPFVEGCRCECLATVHLRAHPAAFCHLDREGGDPVGNPMVGLGDRPPDVE